MKRWLVIILYVLAGISMLQSVRFFDLGDGSDKPWAFLWLAILLFGIGWIIKGKPSRP